ncbi:hypothetical protein CN681_26040 [Bacillus toyonensis]|uniref:hypothetical protein n=1 Tax=Bacillus toyonensis TaxID=155322 RepID=UPI000BF232F4|nr:hypothetical protein [Bacillus toyonensis]PEK06527.1 hypothetical protein CN681_26040 [Bacillus toyonensis]PGA50638.1 hypothetical protein COL86_29250 [Bacillus toyonensis]
MSKINEIQNKLGELNGGEFQKLMDAYFAKEYKGEIYPIGSVLKNNNTKTGTPDTLIKPDKGKYIYVEYTVQKNKIVTKFKDDIQKCLDENKTGIQTEQVDKIICCCNTRLGSGEIEELISEGRTKGVNIEVVSLDTLAYKLIDHPFIINDFLGISIDTQQILDLEDFIKLNDSGKLATPLDMGIFGREEEITEIITSINDNQITILSGYPGIGKTRISLESIRAFRVNHDEYELKCLRNNGQNIYDDLNLYFNRPGYYLIMVDDANLMTNIQFILDLFSWESKGVHIKLLLTVREYAEMKIIDKISKYQYEIFKINPLKEEDIKLLCEHFEVRNSKYIERIYEISKGNPRLAIMACSTAKRENNLKSVENTVDLLESYYQDVKLHFETELENKELLKVAAILSFLNHVNLRDEENIKLICGIANVEKETFLNLILKLHYMEIIDIHEDELVKISDQILSVYLFYLTIFKEKLIPYKLLLDQYYPLSKNRVIENLNNVFSYFYKEDNLELVKEAVKKKYDENVKNSREDEKEEYLKVFWFALEIEGLLYSKNKIEAFQMETNVNLKFELKTNNEKHSNILSLLAQYKNSGYYLEAIDLILLYLEKKPSEFSSVYHVLIGNFGFDERSVNHGYIKELELLKKIDQRYSLKKDILYTNLLFETFKYYLKFYYEHTRWKEKKMVRFFYTPLYLEGNLPKIRERVWERLRELYKQKIHSDEIHKLLYNYIPSKMDFVDIDVLKLDKDFIEIIITEMEEVTIEQAIVFNRLNKLLQIHNIRLNESSEKLISTYEYDIYQKLFGELKAEEMNILNEEGSLKEWFNELSEGNICELFNICKKVVAVDYLSSKKYAAAQRLETLFLITPQSRIMRILQLFFNKDIQISVYPGNIMKNIVDLEQLKNTIVPLEFYNKGYWLYCVYREMSFSNPNSELLKEIYNYFNQSEGEVSGYYRDILFLETYIKIDEDVFINVINSLLKEEDVVVLRSLEDFINKCIESEEYTSIYLKNDIDLLKKIYIRLLKMKQYFDYDSAILQVLTRWNSSILKEVIENILEDEMSMYEFEENISLQFIWKEENWFELSEMISELIVKYIKVPVKYIAAIELLEELLHIDTDILADEYRYRLFEWVNSKIILWSEDEALIKILFQCLVKFNDDQQIDWIIKLIQTKPEFDLFKKIPFLPRISSWSGSEIPSLKSRQLFYRQLEQKIHGIQFLEHKQWLQERINIIEDRIKEAKIKELVQDI